MSKLTAIRLGDYDDMWPKRVSKQAGEVGLEAEIYRTRVWIHNQHPRRERGLVFHDGWEAWRCWLGPNQASIAFGPRRRYLDGKGCADYRREFKILGGRDRPLPPMDLIARTLELVDSMSRTFGPAVELQVEDEDALRFVRRHGPMGHSSVQVKLVEHYFKNGILLGDPEPIVLVVDTVPGVPGYSSDFHDRLKRVAGQWNINQLSVHTAALARLETRLAELDAGESPKRRVAVVLCLGPREDHTPTRTLEVMRRLDQYGLRWRRAHSDDDRRWSVRDQFGSVLQALQAPLFTITYGAGKSLPWTIGIDLSHPHGSDTSTVAAALLDPGGSFVHAWTTTQRRDESISPPRLRSLLREASSSIDCLDPDAGVLIVRDGRLFEQENPRSYVDDLGRPATLVEVRKRMNPIAVDESNQPASCTIHAIDRHDGNEQVRFLSPATTTGPSGGQSGRGVLKITWRRDLDGLELDECIPRVLLSHYFTPGLGLHQRNLPGPLYWADGIASASEYDFRFRGQPVTQID